MLPGRKLPKTHFRLTGPIYKTKENVCLLRIWRKVKYVTEIFIQEFEKMRFITP